MDFFCRKCGNKFSVNDAPISENDLKKNLMFCYANGCKNCVKGLKRGAICPNCQKKSQTIVACFYLEQEKKDTLPYLLYNGPDPDSKICTDAPFPASNEIDWLGHNWDDTWNTKPAPMVIAFGTNSGWDVAVRLKAKEMVMVDWMLIPLECQEYLLRPLLAISKSRAEFLSNLAGVPIAGNTLLNDVWKQLGDTKNECSKLWNGEMTKAKNTFSIPGSLLPTIQHLCKLLAQIQLSTTSQFTPQHVNFVREYLAELCTFKKISKKDYSNQDYFGPFRPPKGYNFKLGSNGNIWAYYYDRYCPDQAVAHIAKISKDAGESIANVPVTKISTESRGDYFSFLSSEVAYNHLKKLFQDNAVWYAKGDFYGNLLWEAVGKNFGSENIIIFGSNINDACNKIDVGVASIVDETTAKKSLLNFLVTVKTYIPQFTFIQTRNGNEPHWLQCYSIEEKDDSFSIQKKIEIAYQQDVPFIKNAKLFRAFKNQQASNLQKKVGTF